MSISAIEWTDRTWNWATGCDRISPGCAHCYAKAEHDRRHGAALAGTIMPAQYSEPFEVVQFHPDRVLSPIGWKKPSMVFTCSGGDPFHASLTDDQVAQAYATMILAYWHTFQNLTKRPERRRELLTDQDFRERVAAIAFHLLNGQETWRLGSSIRLVAGAHVAAFQSGAAPLNVWEMTSVENQHWANIRIPELLATPATVRGLSCEPLLGPLDGLSEYLHEQTHTGPCAQACFAVDWVIVGGESGSGARPCDLAWIRSIVQQCQAAGVPVFVKQIGSQSRENYRDSRGDWPVDLNWAGGKPCPPRVGDREHDWWTPALKDRKGGDPAEWPDDLRVREFPEVRR